MKQDFNAIKRSISDTLVITKYSILMFFREKTAIFFSLFIPIMLMSIFGLLNQGSGVKFNVAVVDQANNAYSKQVVQTMEKVSAFRITTGETKDQAVSDLKNAKFAYVLVLPKNFGSNFSAAQAATTVQKLLGSS